MLRTLGILLALCRSASAAQTLALAGEPDMAAGVKRTTLVPHFDLMLFLELDSSDVKKLAVGVDDFKASDSSVVRPVVKLNGGDSKTIEVVKQADRPKLEITADFPTPGDYKSFIVLTYNDVRQKSIPLIITRAQKPLSIKVVGLNTVAASGFLSRLQVEVDFGISETAGQQMSLNWPSLLGFARKAGDKTRQANVTWNFDAASCKAESSVLVQPGRTCETKLILSGFADAGEYSGKIHLSNSDATSVDESVTVFVKENWFTAWLFIFVGVLASYSIRRYTKESRPKLMALRSAADLRESLGQVRTRAGALGDVETKVFDGLGTQIATVERDISRGTSADNGAAAIKELETKIGLVADWLNIGRMVLAVTPQSLVDTPRESWKALADSFFLKKGSTVDLGAQLTKIETDVKAAIKSDLLARIEAFEKLTASVDQEWAKEIKEVLDLLAVAKREVNDNKFSEGSGHFQAARGAYFKISVGELRNALNNPIPPGFTAADWDSLSVKLTKQLADIEQQTDPDAALGLFQTANREYILAIIGALKSKVADLKFEAKGLHDIEEKLDSVSNSLAESEAALNSGKPDQALAEYEKAVASLTAVDVEILQRGLRPQGGVQATLSPASFVVLPEKSGVAETPKVSGAEVRRQATAERLSQLLEHYDLLLNAGILIIASIAGLAMLWANDPVWGGATAYFTAWLWGLGLQQAGGATLDGLPAVTKKLTE